MNGNVTFLIQVVLSMYAGRQNRCTTVSAIVWDCLSGSGVGNLSKLMEV